MWIMRKGVQTNRIKNRILVNSTLLLGEAARWLTGRVVFFFFFCLIVIIVLSLCRGHIAFAVGLLALRFTVPKYPQSLFVRGQSLCFGVTFFFFFHSE